MTIPPTKESKMPEVIYTIANSSNGYIGRYYTDPSCKGTSYTRTDKVQELKEALEASYQMYYHTIKCPSCLGSLLACGNFCDEHLKLTTKAVLTRDKALTKASNLLK